MFLYFKKYLLILMSFSLVFSNAGLVFGQASTVGGGDLDLSDLGISVGGSTAAQATPGVFVVDVGTRTNTLSTILQKIWEVVKKTAQITLKKMILDRLVDFLIAFINGGYKGGFVVDWDQLLEDAKQNAVGELARQLGAGQ